MSKYEYRVRGDDNSVPWGGPDNTYTTIEAATETLWQAGEWAQAACLGPPHHKFWIERRELGQWEPVKEET